MAGLSVCEREMLGIGDVCTLLSAILVKRNQNTGWRQVQFYWYVRVKGFTEGIVDIYLITSQVREYHKNQFASCLKEFCFT